MSTLFEGEALRMSIEEDVLFVELGREPMNEIGTVTLAELERVATFLKEGAPGARAMLLGSRLPRGFCAGADLRELYAGILRRRAEGADADMLRAEVRAFLDRVHAVFDAFDMASIPTVAAVHGFCFGGGFELALTADVIVADKSARFCFPELRLGLIPGFGGLPRLGRELGNAVIRDLLFTGRSLNASRAHEVGLVSQVVARGQALEVARKVAEQMQRFDPKVTATAKRFVKKLPHEELVREREIFVDLFTSPTVEAALERFVHSSDRRPYLP